METYLIKPPLWLSATLLSTTMVLALLNMAGVLALPLLLVLWPIIVTALFYAALSFGQYLMVWLSIEMYLFEKMWNEKYVS